MAIALHSKQWAYTKLPFPIEEYVHHRGKMEIKTIMIIEGFFKHL